MLYIIYGLTLSVSRVSRDYFTEKGIRQIDKINFETENIGARPSDGKLHLANSREEVEACEYKYESHGRLVGFTAKQIEDAVLGKNDALLTFSSTDFSFLNIIKDAYGDHVVIIFAYIEDKSLEKMTNALPASDIDKKKRLDMGKSIKEHFFNDRHIFDETVIYSGEDTLFNLENLKIQYDHIIKKYKGLEKDFVSLPYKGNKPYIFVSYSRADTETILPYLHYLQKHGCRIWYDKGIRGGETWLTTLALKINGCAQFLVFSSKDSTESTWASYEIEHAINIKNLPILAVRLDDSRFSPGIEMCLNRRQQLDAREKDFEDNLLNSVIDNVIERIG